jgi:hypothetical protein
MAAGKKGKRQSQKVRLSFVPKSELNSRLKVIESLLL